MNKYIEPPPELAIYPDTTDPGLAGLNFEPAFASKSLVRLMHELKRIEEDLSNGLEVTPLLDSEIEQYLRIFPVYIQAALNVNIAEISTKIVKQLVNSKYPVEVINNLLSKLNAFFDYLTTCKESEVFSEQLFEELIKFSFYLPEYTVPLIHAFILRKLLLQKIGK